MLCITIFLRYSNSYFSITLGLFSSINVSIASLLFVEDNWIEKPKSFLIIVLPWWSKSFFLIAATGNFFPTEVSIKKFCAEEDWDKKLFVSILASDSQQSSFSEKGSLNWFCAVFKTLFIPTTTRSISYIKIAIESSSFGRVFNWKINVFLPFIRFLMVQTFLEKTFEFHIFSELKNLFSQITSFITCNWVGIENFPDVENFSMGELSIYVPCIRVLKVRKLQKCYLYWFRSTFKRAILNQQKLVFRYRDLNIKHNFCENVLREKTINSVRCISTLNVQLSKKTFCP